jgi:hypothetical protein
MKDVEKGKIMKLKRYKKKSEAILWNRRVVLLS